jgi:hypothetical protein
MFSIARQCNPMRSRSTFFTKSYPQSEHRRNHTESRVRVGVRHSPIWVSRRGTNARIYVKCTAVRLTLHVPCGDRYAQHCFLLEASIADFLIERLPFARARARIKGSGGDSASHLGGSPMAGSAFQVCLRRLLSVRYTICGWKWARPSRPLPVVREIGVMFNRELLTGRAEAP